MVASGTSRPRHLESVPRLYGDRVQETQRRTWLAETAGAVADLGVLVPIAVGLIVLNGISATAALLPAAILYLIVARTYRLPVAVQPLKAFGAIAITAGAGVDVIAAGSLLMGVVFLLLGPTGLIDRISAWIPTSVVRGVQLSVAILLGKVGYLLLTATPASFTHQLPRATSIGVACGLLIGLWFLRGRLALVAVALSLVAVAWAAHTSTTPVHLGPSALSMPHLSWADITTAATLLVLPQLPLTFANSCLAPADAARRYFGAGAWRVTPGRLATTLGLANLLACSITGMPVCHGAGGMSAHYAFGARTWRAPLIIGSALLGTALLFGGALAAALTGFPVAVLAALLAVAAITHALLLRDVRGGRDWTVAVVVAGLGVFANLAWGVVVGFLLAHALTRHAAPTR